MTTVTDVYQEFGLFFENLFLFVGFLVRSEPINPWQNGVMTDLNRKKGLAEAVRD